MTKPSHIAGKALHIGVVREGRFIEDRWFRGELAISVGTAAKNTFALPLSTLPEHQALFSQRDGRTWLLFDEKATGKVTLQGRELELAQARREKLATPHGHLFELQLDDSAKGRVTLGEVSFVFNFAAPPPEAVVPTLPKEARGTLWNVTDHTFFSVLLISLVFHACAITVISRRELPPEEAAMEEIPDRFAKLLIPDKPPEEPPKEEEKPAEEAPAKEEKKEAKKEEPKDSAQHKADVQKVVASKGLVKILGSAGGPGSALANVLGAGGGFSDDIGAALAGAGGVAIATEAGGPGRRGEGAAQATGIGGIATSGGGNVRLREKQDVAVHGSVQSDDAEIDSSTVDKEALTRFIKLRINSIRGCYEVQLKRSPSLRGKLVIHFTIGTRGQVTEVSVDSDTMGSDEVASCVMRLIKTWHLPFTPDTESPVSFPFLFSPGG